MTAQIIMLPSVPRALLRRRLPPAFLPQNITLSPRHRRRMKSLATEWGVSLETAVVMMVTAYIDAEGDK